MILAGELAALGVAVLWAFGTFAFECYGAGLSPLAVNRYRTMVAAAMVLTICALWPGFAWPDSRLAWAALVTSGLLSFGLSDTLFFGAMARLGAQTTATSQTAVPVLVAVLAWIGLGERLSGGQVFGLALTLISVTVVLLGRPAAEANRGPRGEADTRLTGIAYAGLAALVQALALVIARAGVSRGVDVRAATLLRVAPSAALLTLLVRSRVLQPAPIVAGQPAATPLPTAGRRHRVGLAGAVLVGTVLSTLLQTYALKHVGAGVCAVLGATYPLWMIPLRQVLGLPGDRAALLPTTGAVVGVGLVVALAG